MTYAASAALRIRPVMGVQETFYKRPVNAVPASAFRVACSSCHLGVMCTPVQLNDSEVSRLDELVATRRRVRRGAALFVAQKAESIAEGIELAKEMIDSGKALAAMEAYIAGSNA